MTVYKQLLELHDLAIKDVQRYPQKRELFHRLIGDTGKHFIGIIGPRGVGKTIILKQLAANNRDAFYLSLDNLEENDLFEIAKTLSETYGYRFLLFDEIHYHRNYQNQLKKIFDFLNIRVIFSSSMSLSLWESVYDLSRRVKLVHLYPFSFREYLFFKKSLSLPNLTIDNILQKEWSPEHLRCEHHFEEYFKGGLYPFALDEPQVLPLLGNIIQKVIKKDIPSTANLTMDDIASCEKTLNFIGRANVDGINYSSISRNIGITKYKAELFIDLLKKAFVLQVVFPKGTNVLKEPKVLMRLPYRLLYRDYRDAVGALREDFAAEMLEMNGLEFYYLKSTRGEKTPDFMVRTGSGEIVIEIGGKGKGREQFKGVETKEKLILSHANEVEGIKRPLFLLGFL